MTSQTLGELTSAITAVEGDSTVRVILLTGTGRAFSAGADVRELKSLTPRGARRFAQLGRRLVSTIENSKKPVIAVVNGYALGGGLEIATACDMIIATNKSIFGIPAVKLGICSVWGVTQRLLHLLGPTRTKEILLVGHTINATRAQEIGLINFVVPRRAMRQMVNRIAGELAENAPLTMALYKSILNRGTRSGYKQGNEAELKSFLKCLGSRDFAEGVTAFLRKGKPRFVGS